MANSSKLERFTEILASDLTYLPNPEQRKVKEAFWTRHNENPLCEPQNLTLSAVLQVVGDGRLDRWWPQPGFKEWFRNQEEFRERAAALAHLALDTIQSILIDQSAQPSARVSAAKLAFEIARKMPDLQKSDTKYLDAQIQKMDQRQLEAYLARNVHHLPPATGTDQLTVNPTGATVTTD